MIHRQPNAVIFAPGERAVVDATLDRLLTDAREAGILSFERFSFAEHHRWARSEIRRGQKTRPVFSDVANLLLQWARHCGSLELYVDQPFVHWARARVTGTPWPSSLADATARVEAAPIDFIAFARRKEAGPASQPG